MACQQCMTVTIFAVHHVQTMVHLPFKEDLRTYQFPTFSSEKRPEIAPTDAQLNAARRLVQQMDLTQSEHCWLTLLC